MSALRSISMRLAETGVLVPLLFLITLLTVYGAVAPSSLQPSQLQYTLVNASLTLALAAAGLTLVVLIGGLDLSSAGVIALTNAVLAVYYGGGLVQQFLLLGGVVILGVAAGVINGLVVTRFSLEPVVVTLGTGFIYSGIALWLLPQPQGLEIVEGFSPLAYLTRDVAGIPGGLILIVAVVTGWFLLRRSRFGAQIMAVGSDSEAAANSGIRVGAVSVKSFALAGGLYGLAGIALTSHTSGGDSQLGSSYLLAAFAAVVVGGVKLGGGRGSVLGAVLGAICVTVVVNVLFVLGFASFWGTIAQGTLLLIALGAQGLIAATLLRGQRKQSIAVGGRP